MTIKNVKFETPETGSSSSNPSVIEGSATVDGASTLITADMSSRELLEAILIELKKMNLRQEAVFGEQVNDGDVT